MVNKEIQITNEKLEKYFSITERAFKIASKNVVKGKEWEAKEILLMATNYLNDAHFFEKKLDLVNAFAAINYAHGWLDCGVRLGIFNTKNNKLFTIK
jgi:hypothetical protein